MHLLLAIVALLDAQDLPGAVTVKGRIDYQICDPNVCFDNSTSFSFPLTVLAAAKAEGGGLSEVKVLTVKPSKSEVKVGETIVVAVEVAIPKNWHIYPTYP